MRDLQDKIAKIKSLLRGAKTDGERRAAQAALDRLMASCKEESSSTGEGVHYDKSYRSGHVWTNKYGDRIPYEELDDFHLINIINMVKRLIKDANRYEVKNHYCEILANLEKEWRRRYPYSPDYSDFSIVFEED